jgi:GDP-D-mannose 3',5'-epimerase
MKTVVLGAGGFIGGHLTKRLQQEGHQVVGFDVKPPQEWWQIHGASYANLDLGNPRNYHWLVRKLDDADEVYLLAADMGGMGFIENHKLECMLTTKTSTACLSAAAEAGVGRLFYASSACVYAADKQRDTDVRALREEDAYPAMPEDGYGWEKLFTERLCRHFSEDADLPTRVARYHNVYGPQGTWRGGREKAPAAICRKVLEGRETGEIEIWGDGRQTRSFMYIDDCIEGTLRIMRSEVTEPLNLGSDQLVSINDLVDMAELISGVQLTRTYNLEAPQGVRGRCSDNYRIRDLLDWTPGIKLDAGLEQTYQWIANEMRRSR